MIRLALLTSLLATPVFAADTKEQSCAYQGDVVAAVQQARVDRVRERKVTAKIRARDNNWPDNYDNMIPLITPWIYEMDRADLKKDLRAVWVEGCLAQP